MITVNHHNLKNDSIPGVTLSFEVWCYTRSQVGHGYLEKEWKVCDKPTESIANSTADELQKKHGWGFRGGVNTTGRRYFVKVISTQIRRQS